MEVICSRSLVSWLVDVTYLKDENNLLTVYRGEITQLLSNMDIQEVATFSGQSIINL